MVGLVGPSGTGKTFSALRLATGIQRVNHGKIFLIDTESRRSLHYADKFAFEFVEFSAPFSPLDYLAAIEYCIEQGAGTIIIDSMSHEHEGPGGLLEMHEAEVQRLSGGDSRKAERIKMLAWSQPKQQRRRLINTLTQLSCDFIFCFRAKEKLKMEKGKEPEPLGFMPIAGDEFVYEMTLKCLLLPGANGVPTWQSEYPGERMMMKLPGQFQEMFADKVQLSEDIGEQLARWAAGEGSVGIGKLLASYGDCDNAEDFQRLEAQRREVWNAISLDQKQQLKEASQRAEGKLSNPRETASDASQAVAALKAAPTEKKLWDVLNSLPESVKGEQKISTTFDDCLAKFQKEMEGGK